ncbi:MAG: aspartate--tRNA ligase [Mycobacteriales bacterium]
MMRTHQAGALRASNAGEEVRLAGWVARRRDHGGVVFVDLRDASGLVQVVFRDAAAAHELRAEYCVAVTGTVARRPPGNDNPELPTGEIEVGVTELNVLSPAAALPFPLDGDAEVGEEARLKWRYLDLRRPGPAAALRLRSRAKKIIHDYLNDEGFLDIDTPYLTRSTPEGARDFLVPVRLQPGTWYALPQSPQLFKQLLMVAGFERYYQIARCFRDEDFRADRQPEFTQLDIELSFLDEEDIYLLTETLLALLWRELLGVTLPLPLPRLTYAEAMARYGSDKPDRRFALELADVTVPASATEVRIFAAEHVGALTLPGGADMSRRELDQWQDWARGRGAKGLAYALVGEGGELRGPLARALTEAGPATLLAAAGAGEGDAVFFAAGPRREALELLGGLRVALARDRGLIPPDRWEFLWVTDAPLFEPDGQGGWTAVHHPFTAPRAADLADFDKRPEAALARAYDVVVNGTEIGGGSIRIHQAEVQRRVFDVIGLTAEEAAAKFGFLLEAFAYGPPPHGGIAFGLDRLCALLAGAESIREVIAFPKTASGADPLTGAPTPISPAQRREAGVDAVPPG